MDTIEMISLKPTIMTTMTTTIKMIVRTTTKKIIPKTVIRLKCKVTTKKGTLLKIKKSNGLNLVKIAKILSIMKAYLQSQLRERNNQTN